MQTLTRRGLSAGLLATLPLPALAASSGQLGHLVLTDGAPLPAFDTLWSRMPLPFTPAEAWRLLPCRVQVEIGAAVIGMALAEYVAGDDHAEADRFLDEDLRDEAREAASIILNKMAPRLWTLFPDLYGPDGDHPTWALAGGLAR